MDAHHQRTERAAATYNAAADHYVGAALAFWDRYGARTIERLKLHTGASVLDVGCGAGASALPAARAVGFEGRVLGVDLAENLLALARSKAERDGLRNVTFRAGDMTNLGLPAASFDAVFSVFSVFFVEDMTQLVRSLWQLVRPGGVLAITTWGPRMFEPVNTLWWEVVRCERADLVSAFNPWDRTNSSEALRDLFNSAEIPNVDVQLENGRQPLRSSDDAWSVVLGTGYRWTYEQLEAAAQHRVHRAFTEQAGANETLEIETNVLYAVVRKEFGQPLVHRAGTG